MKSIRVLFSIACFFSLYSLKAQFTHHNPEQLMLQEFFYPSPVPHDTISYFQDTGTGMYWKESLVISRNHLGIDSSIVFTDSGAAYYYKYEYTPDSIFVSRYKKAGNNWVPAHYFMFSLDSLSGLPQNIYTMADSTTYPFWFFGSTYSEFNYDSLGSLSLYVNHSFVGSSYDQLYYSGGKLSKRIQSISQSCGGDDPVQLDYHYRNQFLDSLSFGMIDWNNQYSYMGNERIISNSFGEIIAVIHNTINYGYLTSNMYVYSGNGIPEEVLVGNLRNPEIANRPLEIELYPNPCHNELHLAGSPQSGVYSIIDSKGRMIQQGNLNAQNAIDVSFLKTGQYFLYLQTDDYDLSFRFLKNL